jgi:hypothetical protein
VFLATSLSVLVAAGLASGVGQAASEEGADWTQGTLPEGLTGLELHDVVAGGPGFIAVGGGFRDGATTSEALILTSTDGVDWQAVGGEQTAGGTIRSVVSVGGQWYLAVGGQCCPDVAAEWVSTDGLAWQRFPDQPAFFSSAMFDVTYTSAGFLAVGCQANLECSGGTVWQSADAAEWRSANPFLWLPSAVIATMTGFVAVGGSDIIGGRPVAAASADGASWEPAALPEVEGSLSGLAFVPDGLVAVGSTRDADTMAATGLVLHSPDGSVWTAREPDAVSGAMYEDVTVGGEVLLLVGASEQGDGTTAAAAWWSMGGEPPTMDMLSADGEDAWARSVAVSADGSTAVVVGTLSTPSGAEPGIWTRALGG